MASIMSDKEHHHVHFGEDSDGFGKDNEIVVQTQDNKISYHLGFLRKGHRYEVTVPLPSSFPHISDLMLSQVTVEVPNPFCKLTNVVETESGTSLVLELLAHKEKIIKETLSLNFASMCVTQLTFYARVLGKEKGTPLLRNGIKSIGVEHEEESESSDWHGFD